MIVGVLAVTTVASLVAVRLKPELAEQSGAITAPPLAKNKEEAARLVEQDEREHAKSPTYER